MPMPSKSVILYDQTSAANTALDTDTLFPSGLDTSDFDAIEVILTYTGGVTGGGTLIVGTRVSGYMNQAAIVIAAGAAWNAYVFGPNNSLITGQNGSAPCLLSNNTRVQIPAAGIGVTTHALILGRRNYRGSIRRVQAPDGITPTVLD